MNLNFQAVTCNALANTPCILVYFALLVFFLCIPGNVYLFPSP